MSKLYNPFTDQVVEFGKAVSGPRGANFPDRDWGASTPMIGQTRLVATGRGKKQAGSQHSLERFTGLSGDYSGLPKNRGRRGAHKLGHYKKGRDRAAREFLGKADVAKSGALVPLKFAGAGGNYAKLPKFKGIPLGNGKTLTGLSPKGQVVAAGTVGTVGGMQLKKNWGGERNTFGGGVETTPLYSHNGQFAAQAGRVGGRL